MNRRFALPLSILLAAAPLLAQPVGQPPAVPTPAEAPPPPLAAPVPATVRVTIQTSEGPIVLALEKERAPITTGNFLRYLDAKRLDGTTFYRAVKVGEGYGLVQFGVKFDPKRLYPSIAHEPTTTTGLSHVDGAISMARNAPGSANGDFFITIGDIPSMDADPKAPGDNLGFAVFGRVVEGMDVIRKILIAPTSPTLGEGVMKGQMLSPPIKVVTARRGG